MAAEEFAKVHWWPWKSPKRHATSPPSFARNLPPKKVEAMAGKLAAFALFPERFEIFRESVERTTRKAPPLTARFKTIFEPENWNIE
jgi:hypothetical protein